MKLTDEQKKMLDGTYGPGFQKAMDMLVKYGNAFDAEQFIKLDSGHIFATDPLEFVSQILEGVDEIRAVASIHAAYPAETKWYRTMGIPAERGEHESKIHEKRVELMMNAGFLPVFTCAPYLTGNILRKDTIFSWPGSSGIIIGNSLFGGRGNRDASPTSLCCAITGFTPDMLLYKPENRQAEMLIQLEGLELESFSEADFGALGYYIGSIAGTKNVAVVGPFSKGIAFENYKYFLSPMPVSGAVSLCHIVGVTPEAPTLESVVKPGKSVEKVKVGVKEVKEAYEKLYTAETNQVDAVLFGCPHCTISEIKKIVQLLDGNKVTENVRLWVSTCQAIYDLAKKMGYMDVIENSGGQMLTDICIMNIPFRELETGVKTTATNSARAAHYHARGGVAGGTGVEVLYGSTEECINAAITGKWGG
ncbi:aconitase X [Thermodesulfobacteriota bacterium]